MREIEYALRRLRSSPTFTIAATLTLAIAIGATASVFALVDGVVLKAFPYRDPDRVLTVWESNPTGHSPKTFVGPADYLDFRAQAHAFTALAAASYMQVTMTGSGEPERLSGFAVTPSYFPAMGITPMIGRALGQDSSGVAEAVIGYGFWRRRFGGSPSVIGQRIALDDHPYTIVGVMPSGLAGNEDVWTRLSLKGADVTERGDKSLVVVGRLASGQTSESAEIELRTIAHRLAQAYPQTNEAYSVITVPLLDELLGSVRPALAMLFAAAACVLLIGAANLANLFLVRCLGRQREMALRTALGATRGRLVRELSIEALTLGLIAGALGIGVAVGGIRGLRALAPAILPRLSDVRVDGRVVAFCALVSIVTVVLFGMAPAWQASGGRLADVLKQGGRGTGSAQQRWMQNALVVLQVAVALVLLTGAGLLVESVGHFRSMELGFRPEGVLTAQIALPAQRYSTPDRQSAFVARVVEQLRAQPGIVAASASSSVPAAFGNYILGFGIVGDPEPDPEHVPLSFVVAVGPDYFKTLGIPLQRGRGVLSTDDSRAVRVAVVDERLAKAFFGNRDPIDQRINFIGLPDTMQIVGIVASVKQGGFTESDRPGIYLSLAQTPDTFATVAVRSSGDPAAQTDVIRRVIGSLDPAVPVFNIETMSDRMADTVGTTRFATFLATLFAIVALVLGVVGIYSVLAYVVAQRHREIAVRIALGADRRAVMGGVLRLALALAAVGIALGGLTAWMVTRVLADLFVGVSPHDPAVFVGAASVFLFVALAAASIPAFRTTRINPIVALSAN
jgi:putative ABC transport system permease protein